MKQKAAFFIAMVFVSIPVTKVSAYWIDRLTVDFSTMFVYPTQIIMEKGGEETGTGDLFGQNQFNQQMSMSGEDNLLNSYKNTSPVQKSQTQIVGEKKLYVNQGEIKHDMVPEVSNP